MNTNRSSELELNTGKNRSVSVLTSIMWLLLIINNGSNRASSRCVYIGFES